MSRSLSDASRFTTSSGLGSTIVILVSGFTSNESARHRPYSDFADSLGDGTEVEIPGTGGAVGSPEFAQFRKKAQRFLSDNLADEIVTKVRSGEPLTGTDMDELQRVLVAAGIGDTEGSGRYGREVKTLSAGLAGPVRFRREPRGCRWPHLPWRLGQSLLRQPKMGGCRFVVSRRKRNVVAGVVASWQAAPRHEQPPSSTLVGSLVGTVICPRRFVDG